MNNRGRDRAIPKSHRGSRGTAAGSRNSQVQKVKSGRESIESFVVVFLAFLIWSLEAEGFVIPTGSMAPTLMGRHKELACPQCGDVYRVNADREVERSGPMSARARGSNGGPARTAASRRPWATRRVSRRPDLCHEAGPLAAVLPEGGPGSTRSVGRGGLQVTESRRSVTSSGWPGCRTRSCASRKATCGSSRRTVRGHSNDRPDPWSTSRPCR